jgi:hypothetical protein
VAAIAASFLMLLSGWAYRALAAQLGAPLTTTPIAPDALERLPMQIADWTGEDVPLDEAIVRRTDTDAHINRRYSRSSGLESVSLYVACGVRTRNLIVHRPEVCYIGAGWTRTGRHLRELPLSNGTILPCIVFEFSRGVLDTTKIVVLYCYIVDGQYCHDLSEWRYRYWRIGYVAQVQIVASVTETLTADEATRIVCNFAVDSASPIAGQLEHIEKRQSAGSVRELREWK